MLFTTSRDNSEARGFEPLELIKLAPLAMECNKPLCHTSINKAVDRQRAYKSWGGELKTSTNSHRTHSYALIHSHSPYFLLQYNLNDLDKNCKRFYIFFTTIFHRLFFNKTKSERRYCLDTFTARLIDLRECVYLGEL